MINTYAQGESFTVDLSLVRNAQPLVVGPLALTPTLVNSITVLLKVNADVQARYRYPADATQPGYLPLGVDAVQASLIHVKVNRQDSRFFAPGFLTASVLIEFIDANYTGGRAVEVVLPVGYITIGETAGVV